MAQHQNPKTLINQFYQRAKADPPRYEVELAPVDGQENRFICTLILPSVTAEGETLPEQIFQEEGRSKKAAQDAAAATAFQFLSEQPVYGNLKPYEESLLRTLATRGLFRDPEMHGAAASAVAYLDGYLPLAALPHSRILRGWAKEYGKSYDPDLASDPMALVDVVRRELAAQAEVAVPPKAAAVEAAESAAAEAALTAAGLHCGPPGDPAVEAAKVAAAGAAAGAAAALGWNLGPSGLCVRLPRESAESAPPGVIWEEVDPAIEAAGGVASLVVIPADSSLPLREESIPARGCLLWGRVGHKASVIADPRVASAAALAAAAAPKAEEKGPPPSRPRRHPDSAGATPTASEQSICLPPSGSVGTEVTGGLRLLEQRIGAAAAAGLGDADGGGGGAVITAVSLAQPPASPCVYRAESTLSLAVHRGPAAMDWEADGQTEVRGPEHVAAPSATGGRAGGGGPRGGRQSGAQGRGAAKTAPAGRSATAASANRSGGGGGGAAAAAGAGLPALQGKRGSGSGAVGGGGGSGGGGHNASGGGSSPRHLMLPPLPATPSSQGGGRRSFDAAAAAATAAAEPPPLASLRNAIALLSPAAYTRAAHAPLLLRGLPAEYRGPASWVGPPPRQLLDNYMAAHSPAAAITSLELVVPDVDLPGEGLAELAGTNFLGLPYKVTAGPGPLDIVSQQVALSALLELQSLDAACLGGTVTAEQLTGQQQPQQQPPTPSAPTQQQQPQPGAATRPAAAAAVPAAPTQGEGATAEAVGEVEVLDPGLAHARQPQEGSMVKIGYYISLPPYQRSWRPTGGSGSGAAEGEEGSGAEVGQQGEGGPTAPPPPGVGGGLVLEQHPGLTLAVGCAGAPAVPPELDAAVRALRVGGRARCRQVQQSASTSLSVPAEGCDPLGAGFPHLDTCLDLTLLHATLPVVEGRGGPAGAGSGPPLFTPPLGQQRMEAVAAALRREGVATLVDLGCGEGKLVEGLLQGRHGVDCGGPLERVVGVDISRGALQGAARRLGKMRAAAAALEEMPVSGEESVPRPVEVLLYRGSALSPALARRGTSRARRRKTAAAAEAAGGGGVSGADPWVSLRGCDAVAMVEVVEHLDPEPLQLLGPCVLGGLRPRLLLVTTPNWEYNLVMRTCEQLAAEAATTAAAANRRKPNSAGSPAPVPVPAVPGAHWPGPPGRDGLPLRCGDHRFEWTRGEFRSWAEGLAGRWGYDVCFRGIGHANDEAGALMSPGYKGPGDPGEATQMAIFRRKDGEQEGEQGEGEQGEGGEGEGGEGEGEEGQEGESWELVWGPALVAAPREEMEEMEAKVEAADARSQGEGGGGGGAEGGAQMRVRPLSTVIPAAKVEGAAVSGGVKRTGGDVAARGLQREVAAGSIAAGSGGGSAPEGPMGPPAKRQRRAAGGNPAGVRDGGEPPDPDAASGDVGDPAAGGGDLSPCLRRTTGEHGSRLDTISVSIPDLSAEYQTVGDLWSEWTEGILLPRRRGRLAPLSVLEHRDLRSVWRSGKDMIKNINLRKTVIYALHRRVCGQPRNKEDVAAGRQYEPMDLAAAWDDLQTTYGGGPSRPLSVSHLARSIREMPPATYEAYASQAGLQLFPCLR
ncbi:hypothetical protein VOLCADRAFT_98326 [Volvox carteri f. nagariensis]|uniref:Small RNA 2'-O-methyltransferase n=1 Tax=Volvox carteri f. nagariensis TaxID=3068 RepID=D8UEX7_VOLCA|nr:uncharacterized protein VOLCADRAFT_98326 [Volvox carteri f. nagariensis]EFJ41719.1 hypothetical protein VOLCADRAFT_98326 [Volvox carteri f. nagariensis]|eukprot:XP_002957221.1 hypothetical protein VOLCADRAFT_98326 [Volvox carteri f. nagariensis]